MRQLNRLHWSEQGFTLIELVIVLLIIGVLTAALIRTALPLIASSRIDDTRLALETARDALIAFAAANDGCLPFAADYEGGLPDTDATGAATPGYADTGVGKVDLGLGNHTYAGDLPWADLGLGPGFLDGEGLRIQYYVASYYTDRDGEADDADGLRCPAGFRGYEWKSSVTYNGSSSPIYVYYTLGDVRNLYRIDGTLPDGTLPAGTTPNSVMSGIEERLDKPFLELRRGPDPIGGSPSEQATLSRQNVFVLIATGENRNAGLARTHLRDSSHTYGGGPWPADLTLLLEPDKVVFSSTHNIDPTDEANGGDDTLLVMSFISYKAELNKYGLNMEPLCDTTCTPSFP